jgi:hypothetical protein
MRAANPRFLLLSEVGVGLDRLKMCTYVMMNVFRVVPYLIRMSLHYIY